MMKTLRLLMLGLSCCGLLIPSACRLQDNTPHERAAASTAAQWLDSIDAGQYESCWQMSSDIFKNAGDLGDWVASMKRVRLPLGETVQRRLQNARYKDRLPGAPPGQYVLVNFETEFANKNDMAIETVATVLNPEGQWRVAGYHIK